MTQQIKERQLKAYSVMFDFEIKDYADEFDYNVTTIIAHNSKEAEVIFTKYALAKNLNIKFNEIIVVPQRKTKRNKYMINKDFYIKQNDFVNKLYEEFKNK